MSHPPVDGEDDYPAALAAFREAWGRLLAAIRATREPQAHFDRASETGEVLSKLVAEDAGERGTAAARILDAESLSLTGLGQRISMSKQRAGKLVEKGRKSRGGQ